MLRDEEYPIDPKLDLHEALTMLRAEGHKAAAVRERGELKEDWVDVMRVVEESPSGRWERIHVSLYDAWLDDQYPDDTWLKELCDG